MELAQVRGYRKQVKNCPYESQSSRGTMKGLSLIHISKKANPPVFNIHYGNTCFMMVCFSSVTFSSNRHTLTLLGRYAWSAGRVSV